MCVAILTLFLEEEDTNDMVTLLRMELDRTRRILSGMMEENAKLREKTAVMEEELDKVRIERDVDTSKSNYTKQASDSLKSLRRLLKTDLAFISEHLVGKIVKYRSEMVRRIQTAVTSLENNLSNVAECCSSEDGVRKTIRFACLTIQEVFKLVGMAKFYSYDYENVGVLHLNACLKAPSSSFTSSHQLSRDNLRRHHRRNGTDGNKEEEEEHRSPSVFSKNDQLLEDVYEKIFRKDLDLIVVCLRRLNVSPGPSFDVAVNQQQRPRPFDKKTFFEFMTVLLRIVKNRYVYTNKVAEKVFYEKIGTSFEKYAVVYNKSTKSLTISRTTALPKGQKTLINLQLAIRDVFQQELDRRQHQHQRGQSSSSSSLGRRQHVVSKLLGVLANHLKTAISEDLIDVHTSRWIDAKVNTINPQSSTSRDNDSSSSSLSNDDNYAKYSEGIKQPEAIVTVKATCKDLIAQINDVLGDINAKMTRVPTTNSSSSSSSLEEVPKAPSATRTRRSRGGVAFNVTNGGGADWLKEQSDNMDAVLSQYYERHFT